MKFYDNVKKLEFKVLNPNDKKWRTNSNNIVWLRVLISWKSHNLKTLFQGFKPK